MAEAPNSSEYQSVTPKLPVQPPAHITHGQKLFNWGVYVGVNGVGNFLLTIPFAYWGLHGGGSKYFKRAGSEVQKLGMSPAHAKEMVEMLGTSLGGWAMLAPVYIAENYRKPAVEWLNQRFGSEEDKHTVVHQPPKQTVGSLLIGRASAMALVWGAFRTAGEFVPEQFERFQKNVATRLCKVFNKPTVDALGNETKAFHYGHMAALDVFATASATVLLYSISRAAAKNREVRRERKEERRPVHLATADDVSKLTETTGFSKENTLLTAIPETRVTGEKEHMSAVMPAPETTLEAAR